MSLRRKKKQKSFSGGSSFFNNDQNLGIALCVPLFLFIFGIIAIPFFQAMYLSLTDKIAGKRVVEFIGFANYAEIWTDPLFYEVLIRTFVYAFVCVLFKLIFGLIIGLALNERFPGRTFFRTTLLIPWAMPGMVVATTWKWMYDGSYGIINSLLLRSGIVDKGIPWLASTNLSLISVIIVNIWRGVPFFLFAILGALQTIDKYMYEAAEIDGAGPFRRFTKITMPCISPIISVSILLSLIWTFNDFDNVFILTSGGPITSSMTMALYSFKTAFMDREFGKSIAISFSVTPFILAITYFARKLQKDRGI